MTKYVGTRGNDRLVGSTSQDEFVGLRGRDVFIGNGGQDVVNYSLDGGRSGVKVNLWGGGSQGGIQRDSAIDSHGFRDSVKQIPNVVGTRFSDEIYGGGKANTLWGGGGKDLLDGYAGRDKLIGGLGADDLTGGLGADAFVFTHVNESKFALNGRDTIRDFSHAQRDRIDVSLIDANKNAVLDQAFRFTGFVAEDVVRTPRAGELRYTHTGDNTVVLGYINADSKPDFAITLQGILDLVRSDFVL